jgi:hypothetical protein
MYAQNFRFKVYNVIKVKCSLYRPWRPLRLREVEDPTFSHIRLTDGGKVVSPTRRSLFAPGKGLSRHQDHSVAGRIRQIKKKTPHSGLELATFRLVA